MQIVAERKHLFFMHKEQNPRFREDRLLCMAQNSGDTIRNFGDMTRIRC
jgi:hypothetical protein